MKDEWEKLKDEPREEEEERFERKIYEDRTERLLRKVEGNVEALHTKVDAMFAKAYKKPNGTTE